jgi:predicted nucleic acid-binding protein
MIAQPPSVRRSCRLMRHRLLRLIAALALAAVVGLGGGVTLGHATTTTPAGAKYDYDSLAAFSHRASKSPLRLVVSPAPLSARVGGVVTPIRSATRIGVAAEAAAGRGSAALDSNVLIRGLDNGELGAVDKALAGRLPNVSPTAASEYLARDSQEALNQFLSERGGSIGLAGTQEGAAALQAQAAGLGRALGLNDALIAHSAMQEGIPLITGDQQLLRFLNAIGYPAEGF